MKYTNIFIFLFMVWIPTMGICQSPMYFSKAYCPEGIATNGGNILLTDSGYLISGSYMDSINKKLRIYLMHIDQTGSINRLDTHGNDTLSYYPGSSGTMIQVNDSLIFWVSGKSNSINDFASLIKANNDLSVLWETDYMYNNDTTYSYLVLTNIIAISDQMYVMCGAQTSSQNISDILLQKTDSLGNLLWRKHYVFKGMSMAWSVIQTPDHGYMLGGGAYLPYINQSFQGIIIKTDSLGNEQWRRIIGNPGYDNTAVMVLNSIDSNYIVIYAVGTELYTPEAAIQRIQVHKINQAGYDIWNKTIGNKMIVSFVNRAIALSNGDILACGQFYPGDTTLPVDSWSWILRTNNNGDSIWMREHYRYNGYLNTNRLYDIKPTPDGGYILVGVTDSFGYIPQSAWVLKVDSLGCAVPGCQYVGMKEVIINKEELVVYPNPARDVIHLKIPEFAVANTKELRIFNASGQEVFRQELPPGDPQPTININHLPNGSYFLRIITPEISIAWSKVVIISK
jgi:hypothetical protein